MKGPEYAATCRLCAGEEYITSHHVTPRVMLSQGFDYEGELPLCRVCHDMLHEETTPLQLAAGGPVFLTQWIRGARGRIGAYRQERQARMDRRKGGVSYNPTPAVPKWKRKQIKRVQKDVDRSRMLWSMRNAFTGVD